MALSDHEREQLRRALKRTDAELTDAELDVELAKYATAARDEYLGMMLGQRVFTRGQDIREYRLFLIIEFVYDGELPSERAISNLFQTSATQSRSMLRAVLSKYQYLLRPGLEKTLRQTLGSAKQEGEGGPWRVQTDSENLIEQLNREISSVDPALTQVSKVAGTVGTYEIPNASYRRLRTQLGI